MDLLRTTATTVVLVLFLTMHFLLADGTQGLLPGILQRFSTAAVAEEPISPPVQVNYTQLLIDGKFVDSASGTLLQLSPSYETISTQLVVMRLDS